MKQTRADLKERKTDIRPRKNYKLKNGGESLTWFWLLYSIGYRYFSQLLVDNLSDLYRFRFYFELDKSPDLSALIALLSLAVSESRTENDTLTLSTHALQQLQKDFWYSVSWNNKKNVISPLYVLTYVLDNVQSEEFL